MSQLSLQTTRKTIIRVIKGAIVLPAVIFLLVITFRSWRGFINILFPTKRPERILLSYPNPLDFATLSQFQFKEKQWKLDFDKIPTLLKTAPLYLKTDPENLSWNNQRVEKLALALGFNEYSSFRPVGDTLNWYDKDFSLSINTKTGLLKFNYFLRSDSPYLTPGHFPKGKRALDMALDFIKEQNLAPSGFNEDLFESHFLKFIPGGFIEVESQDEAEIMSIRFLSSAESFSLEGKNTLVEIRMAKEKIIGILVDPLGLFNIIQANLKIKSFSEIKSAIKKSKGYFTNPCENLSEAREIILNTIELIYYHNPSIKLVQPVFKLTGLARKKNGPCDVIIYLPALKQKYYES